MNWGSVDAFFHMGGYGLYVWGSYLVTAGCVAIELWLIARRKRTLLRQLHQMQRLKNTAS